MPESNMDIDSFKSPRPSSFFPPKTEDSGFCQENQSNECMCRKIRITIGGGGYRARNMV